MNMRLLLERLREFVVPIIHTSSVGTWPCLVSHIQTSAGGQQPDTTTGKVNEHEPPSSPLWIFVSGLFLYLYTKPPRLFKYRKGEMVGRGSSLSSLFAFSTTPICQSQAGGPTLKPHQPPTAPDVKGIKPPPPSFPQAKHAGLMIHDLYHSYNLWFYLVLTSILLPAGLLTVR